MQEHDDGVGKAEDVFRRATFNWAQSTKRMVESSLALGANTRVAHVALVDIEYARDMLDKLFIPKASKTPAAFADQENPLTAAAVRDCVSGIATRIVTTPVVAEVRKTPFNARVRPPSTASRLQAHVDDIVGAPQIVRPPVPKEAQPIDFGPQTHRGTDLSAPVISKNGKMLWATVDCPACPSKATQRCQKPDGGFVEKPHKQRKELAEQV